MLHDFRQEDGGDIIALGVSRGGALLHKPEVECSVRRQRAQGAKRPRTKKVQLEPGLPTRPEGRGEPGALAHLPLPFLFGIARARARGRGQGASGMQGGGQKQKAGGRGRSAWAGARTRGCQCQGMPLAAGIWHHQSWLRSGWWLLSLQPPAPEARALHGAGRGSGSESRSRGQGPGATPWRIPGGISSVSWGRHHLMYNESLELTAPQHTAVKI